MITSRYTQLRSKVPDKEYTRQGDNDDVPCVPCADLFEESEEFASTPALRNLWEFVTQHHHTVHLVTHKDIFDTVLWLNEGSFRGKWETRWFSLKRGFMRLYKSQKNMGHSKPKHLITLVDYTIEKLSYFNEKHSCVRLVPRRKNAHPGGFNFCFETPEKCELWFGRMVVRQVCDQPRNSKILIQLFWCTPGRARGGSSCSIEYRSYT